MNRPTWFFGVFPAVDAFWWMLGYNTKVLMLCTHSHVYPHVSAAGLFILALLIFLLPALNQPG